MLIEIGTIFTGHASSRPHQGHQDCHGVIDKHFLADSHVEAIADELIDAIWLVLIGCVRVRISPAHKEMVRSRLSLHGALRPHGQRELRTE